ncbi:MAG TPA: GntR family transcriptional regulator [Chthoniobacteraceae bacterium]|nr:GntR family transcriptional regulator [Chthoniobacteraceae bacterium]
MPAKPSFKYLEIARLLHRRYDGTGEAILPSERDLAAQFQVHRHTIQQALRLLESEGTVIKKPGRGYFFAARKAASAPVIGFPLWCRGPADLDLFNSPFKHAVLSGIRAGIERAGAVLDVQMVGPEAAPHRERIAELCTKWSAMIMEPPHLGNLDESHPFAPLLSKTVVLGQVQGKDHNCVYCDNYRAAEIAMQHLVDHGASRILLFGGDTEERVHTFLRLSGAETVINRLKGVRFLYVEGGLSASGGYSGIKRALREGMRFDAALAVMGHSALGALRALHDEGLRVPEEVQLVSLGNLALFEYLIPTPTMIDFDVREMGHQAAKMALNLHFRGGRPIASQMLPVRLIQGETSGAVRPPSSVRIGGGRKVAEETFESPVA